MKFPLLVPTLPVPVEVDYPVIEPVREDVHRPFWSVMIPTYNRPGYLEQTLRSVLEQDPGADEMQIEVIDNCSTIGDAEEVVSRVGGERVSFYRQPQTVNPTVQGTTCIRRARGRWVHLLHDDDLVLPGFYTAYKSFIEQHPEVGMVFCSVIIIDEENEWRSIVSAPRSTFNGVVQNAGYEMLKSCLVAAPTAVVARHAYEKIGGLHPKLTYLTDWDLWVRLGMFAPIGYIRHPFLLYRYHSGSESNKMVMKGVRNREVLATIELNVRRLPHDMRELARREAYYYEARNGEGLRNSLHAQGQHIAALKYAFWAFRLDPGKGTFLRLLVSTLRACRERFRL